MRRVAPSLRSVARALIAPFCRRSGALVLAWAVSCAELPQIPAGTCGNAVVEPGEDCDTFGRDGFACRRADPAFGGCRIECNDDLECPAGYGCGVDLVCRRPSGTFAASASVRISVDARRVEAADFDGDRRADPVAQTVAELRVHFFDGRADPARITSITGNVHALSALGAKPSLATLETARSNTLAVWRGQSDRTFATTLYPALAVSPVIQKARVLVADAIPAAMGPQFIGAEYMLATSTSMTSSRLDLGPPDVNRPSLLDWSATPDKVIGPVFGAFSALRQCDVMAYSYGGNTIATFPLCTFAGLPNPSRTPSGTVTALHPVKSIVAARVNADAQPDLVIQPATQTPLEVAYATSGFEGFNSQPTFGVDMKTSLLPWGGSGVFYAEGTLLGAGDLDGDKKVDIVDSAGVHLSSTTLSQTVPLTSAVVKDANRDGFLDVIAIGPFGAYFFLGTGTSLLNPSFNPIDGRPTHLIVADFDGDLVDDVLVGSDLGAGGSKLSVQWGRAFQLPEAPVTVGTLPSIEDMAGGPIGPFLVSGNSASIAIAPILVRRNGSLEAPILYGAASRVLVSPLTIVRLGASTVQRGDVAAIVTGNFVPSDPPHPSVALVTYDRDDGSSTRTPRLWSVRSSGDAEMDPADLVRSTDALPLARPLTSDEGARWWDGPLGAAIDLDGDGIDELVLLAKPEAGGGKGALLIARARSNGFSTEVQPLGAGAPDTVWSARAADIDGDGRLDLILVYGDGTGPICKVALNRGSGTIDLRGAIDVPLPDVEPLLDLAPIRTDPKSRARALVMATAHHLFIAPWNGRTFGAPVEIVDQGKSIGGASTVAVGDVDGDGVEDVMVTRDHAIFVYFQEEQKP